MINEERHVKQSYALCNCSVKSVGVGGNYKLYDRSTLITDYSSGELVCNKCGTVICDTLEDSSQKESFIFVPDQERLRPTTRMPISLSLQNNNLSTIIPTTGRDANGQKLEIRMHLQFKRLSLWDSRIDIHSDLKPQVLHQLSRLKDKLGLSNTILEKSAYFYRKAHQRDLIRGRTSDGILAACIYIACREFGNTRTLKDIVMASNLTRKNIAKNYRKLIQELDPMIPIADTAKCIYRITNNLYLSEKTRHIATEIMNEIDTRNISSGKQPMSNAAVAVYLACLQTGESATQGSISKTSGLTEVTIRNWYKELRMHGVV
jgi:transcription initiation factor TFIIB